MYFRTTIVEYLVEGSALSRVRQGRIPRSSKARSLEMLRFGVKSQEFRTRLSGPTIFLGWRLSGGFLEYGLCNLEGTRGVNSDKYPFERSCFIAFFGCDILKRA